MIKRYHFDIFLLTEQKYSPYQESYERKMIIFTKGARVTLKVMLRQIGDVQARDWDDHLPKTRAAINTSLTTNGHTPFKIMMTRGTDAKMPIDLFACEQHMADDRFNCNSGYLV